MKKYTYDDWLKGVVCLNSCYTVSPPGKIGSFSKVEYSDFDEEDRSLVKAKQGELFDEFKNMELKRMQEIFIKQYRDSRAKGQLVKSLIQRWENVMYREYDQNQPFIVFPPGNFHIDTPILTDIQSYINQYITYGYQRYVSFIHSPNFEFKSDKLHPYIQAQAIFEFHKWLQSGNWRRQLGIRCSNKAIHIAFGLMGKEVDERNAPQLLKNYSKNSSVTKLLQISLRPSQFKQLCQERRTNITNKRASRGDTTLLNDLNCAKYIITCEKDEHAKNEITDLISKLSDEYEARYGKKIQFKSSY